MDEYKNEATNEPRRRRRNAAQEKALEDFRIAQEQEAAGNLQKNESEPQKNALAGQNITEKKSPSKKQASRDEWIEDDFEEERPGKKNGKKKKKKGGSGCLLAVIAALVLAIVLLVVGGMVFPQQISNL